MENQNLNTEIEHFFFKFQKMENTQANQMNQYYLEALIYLCLESLEELPSSSCSNLSSWTLELLRELPSGTILDLELLSKALLLVNLDWYWLLLLLSAVVVPKSFVFEAFPRELLFLVCLDSLTVDFLFSTSASYQVAPLTLFSKLSFCTESEFLKPTKCWFQHEISALS